MAYCLLICRFFWEASTLQSHIPRPYPQTGTKGVNTKFLTLHHWVVGQIITKWWICDLTSEVQERLALSSRSFHLLEFQRGPKASSICITWAIVRNAKLGLLLDSLEENPRVHKIPRWGSCTLNLRHTSLKYRGGFRIWEPPGAGWRWLHSHRRSREPTGSCRDGPAPSPHCPCFLP